MQPEESSNSIGFAVTGSCILTSALPPIERHVDIDGGVSRQGIQRSTAAMTPSFSVFYFDGPWVVNLIGLEISNGYNENGGGIHMLGGTVALTDVVISGCTSTTGAGGGIYQTSGSLFLEYCVITFNEATIGDGGGIYSNGGSLDIDNTEVTSNTAGNSGGGIYSNATLTIHPNCDISNNRTVDGWGGGICLDPDATVEITGSEIGPNRAVRGGGIANAGDLDISGGAIVGNTADRHGGGIYNIGTIDVDGCDIEFNEATTGKGGGICHGLDAAMAGLAEITNSSVSWNSAGESGGGIYTAASLKLTFSDLNGNGATLNGGGVQCDQGAQVTFWTVNILDNWAARGGGFDIINLSTLTMVTCWVSGNEADNELTIGGFKELDSVWNKTNCTIDDPVLDEG